MEKHTYQGQVEALGLHVMENLSTEEYRNYLKEEGLFMVDHHDVLVASSVGYPIAASKVQLDILIEELQAIRQELRDS